MDVIAKIDEIKDYKLKVYEAVKYYTSLGLLVFPIKPNTKNLPSKASGYTLQNGTRKPTTIDSWFNPTNGKFAGWNVSLITGKENGVFVLDLDRKPGKDNGVEEFKELKPDDWTYNGPQSRTPNNGLHLFFRWTENCMSSTGKIGRGIDTRGGDGGSQVANVMVWPSIVGGVPYTWLRGGNLGTVPKWISDKLGIPWKAYHPVKGNRGNELVDTEAFEDKFSPEQIQNFLDYIDPDILSYSDWLAIGQAINSQHPSNKGLVLWDEWSKKGKRYEEGECEKRWQGFDPNGPVRIGTIIHWAREGGKNTYEMPLQQNPHEENRDIVEELNESYAIIPLGSSVMVLEDNLTVPEGEEQIRAPYRFLKKSAFYDLYANQQLPINVGGQVKLVGKAEFWWSSPDRRQYPGGITFDPSKPKEFSGYYNTWQGLKYEPSPEGSWKLFSDHILNIMCDGNRELHTWVVDWMADLVQDPANPKGCAIVMRGIEGAGKGTFAQYLGKLFGTHFAHITEPRQLVGNFNSHMESKVLVFADEVVFGGDRKAAGKLKAMVTEKIVMIEMKGVDAVPAKNCVHVIVSSNEKWVVPAGENSRRWLVLDVPSTKANDVEYFTAIKEQMENGGYERMLHDLQNRKITSNLRWAPETEGLLDQRARYASTDPTNEWIAWSASRNFADVDRVYEDEVWPSVLLPQSVFDAFDRWCKDNGKNYRESEYSFFSSFQKAVPVQRARPRINGQRLWVYKISDQKYTLEQIKKTLPVHIMDNSEEDEDE